MTHIIGQNDTVSLLLFRAENKSPGIIEKVYHKETQSKSVKNVESSISSKKSKVISVNQK